MLMGGRKGIQQDVVLSVAKMEKILDDELYQSLILELCVLMSTTWN